MPRSARTRRDALSRARIGISECSPLDSRQSAPNWILETTQAIGGVQHDVVDDDHQFAATGPLAARRAPSRRSLERSTSRRCVSPCVARQTMLRLSCCLIPRCSLVQVPLPWRAKCAPADPLESLRTFGSSREVHWRGRSAAFCRRAVLPDGAGEWRVMDEVPYLVWDARPQFVPRQPR